MKLPKHIKEKVAKFIENSYDEVAVGDDYEMQQTITCKDLESFIAQILEKEVSKRVEDIYGLIIKLNK